MTHDITIFRSDGGLHPDIQAGKRGITDSAYKILNGITVHIEGHSKEMKNFINCVLACHENFNARLKCFKILSETFHGSWCKKEEHKMGFEAICIYSCLIWHGKWSSTHGNINTITYIPFVIVKERNPNNNDLYMYDTFEKK